MARERFIYPEIWSSESFLQLSIHARFLWLALITLADDVGRGRAAPILLKARVFPVDQVELDQISRHLSEISGKGMIRLYEVEGNHYYDIPNWSKYQHLKYAKESKLPSNPENSPQIGPKLDPNFAYVGLRRDTLRLSPPTPSPGGEREQSAPPAPEDAGTEAAWKAAVRLIPKFQLGIKSPTAYVRAARKDTADPFEAFPWLREAMSGGSKDKTCPGCGRPWDSVSKKTGASICLDCERKGTKP